MYIPCSSQLDCPVRKREQEQQKGGTGVILGPLTNHLAAVTELMAGEGGLLFTQRVFGLL